MIPDRWAKRGLSLLAVVLLGFILVAGNTLARWSSAPPAPAGPAHAVRTGRANALPPLVQGALSAAVGRAEEAYHARHAGAARAAAVRLRNAAHGLSVTAAPTGVQIEAGGAAWRLSLAAWGYGEHLMPVASAPPEAAGNHVTYRRGALSEWYVNGPLGLQQGFTLARPPGGARRAGSALGGRQATGARPPRPYDPPPLTLALDLGGDLHATVDTDRRSLTLATADGTARLHYRGLTAYDATERPLPAWLELHADRLLLRVDDTGAHYPVVIDPFVERARLYPADADPYELFG
ncbi:MAG: hypothetical protein ACRDIB_16620, partial [Ardenticatenaceae bacterium]